MGNLKATLPLYKYLWTSQGRRSLNQSLRRLKKRMLKKANKGGIILEGSKLYRMKISMLMPEIKLMKTRANKALMKVQMGMIRIKISLSLRGQK